MGFAANVLQEPQAPCLLHVAASGTFSHWPVKGWADGAYRLVVWDLNGQGGPRFAYWLRRLAPEPDFALTRATDRIEAAPGKAASLVVTIDRAEGGRRADRGPGGGASRGGRVEPGDVSARGGVGQVGFAGQSTDRPWLTVHPAPPPSRP